MKKFLSVCVWLGVIGAAVGLAPFVIQMPRDFPLEAEELLNYGMGVAEFIELILVCLLAYKVHKDGLSKPVFIMSVVYAACIAIGFIAGLASEELETVVSIATLVLAVAMGVVCMTVAPTRMIGACLIIWVIVLILVVSFAEPGHRNKMVAAILILLYASPFIGYLTSIQNFLCPSDEAAAEATEEESESN